MVFQRTEGRVGSGLYGRRTATARAPNLFDRSRRDGGILSVSFSFFFLLDIIISSCSFFLGIRGVMFGYAGDA